MNIALLMMGGVGQRVGAPIPKQFLNIDDKPIFAYILSGLNKSPYIDKIVVVTHSDWHPFVHKWIEILNAEKVYSVVSGGGTRSESVLNGLKSAAEFASGDDIVMIHDATHPYVDDVGIKELIEAVKEYGGATLGQRQFDTCYRVNSDDILEEVIPRQYIVSGASPEAFFFGRIFKIYNDSDPIVFEKMTSAGAIALANGIRMKVCTLHTLNLKVTYPEDLELLKHLMTEYFFPYENVSASK